MGRIAETEQRSSDGKENAQRDDHGKEEEPSILLQDRSTEEGGDNATILDKKDCESPEENDANNFDGLQPHAFRSKNQIQTALSRAMAERSTSSHFSMSKNLVSTGLFLLLFCDLRILAYETVYLGTPDLYYATAGWNVIYDIGTGDVDSVIVDMVISTEFKPLNCSVHYEENYPNDYCKLLRGNLNGSCDGVILNGSHILIDVQENFLMCLKVQIPGIRTVTLTRYYVTCKADVSTTPGPTQPPSNSGTQSASDCKLLWILSGVLLFWFL